MTEIEELKRRVSEKNEMLASHRDEIGRLMEWKESVMEILTKWDAVWEAAGRPGKLGSSKAESVREFILSNV